MLEKLWGKVKELAGRVVEFFTDEQTELTPEDVVGSVIKETLRKVDYMVEQYVVDSWGALVDELSFLGTTLFTLYIVYFGYQLLSGRVRLTMGEAVGRVVKMLVVYVFFVSTPALIGQAYGFFNDTPQAVGHVLVRVQDEGRYKDTASIVDSLDKIGVGIWNWYGVAVRKVEKGETGFKNAITFVLSVTTFALSYSTFLLVMAKVAIGLLLGLGPFFVAFLLFPVTRHLFDGWIKQLISFALVPILVYAVWAMFLDLIADSMTQMNAWFGTVDVEVFVKANTDDQQTIKLTYNQSAGILIAPFALLITTVSMVIMQVRGWAAAIAGSSALGDGLQAIYHAARLPEATKQIGGGGAPGGAGGGSGLPYGKPGGPGA